ncbi:hypothetical protein CONLIGDRAFT_5263 [Coniochaeta ligniaria NRRL 30616]|uniref:Uncharacterized protein n=1 Tax=Coniochaeta ligniaria NRRL 30616 TaxID=1408157 RepID=A0A1J7J4R5_9PEZI|nr:hypothetical protein CONLIGDRAFT_5263 [Coniochaeta ligniaria NRRL 30616]
MAGFAKLIPAFTVQIHVDPATPIGALSTGPALVHLPFVPNSGFLKSEPDYPVKVDAVFVHGADYVKVDKDGKFARLEVQSTLRAPEGALRYNYTGTVDISGPGGKIIRGEADAATTDFGGIFAQPIFETGTAAFQALEGKTFVQSGRFIIEQGKPVIVEYKISEVTY